jgi:carbon-monoxide dehydrogenase small subunit
VTRLALTVNGREACEDVEPRVHLADFLRERLLLTGTRLGCEHGVCGACTVLLDDEPVRSCITYAVECEGRHVRTIEGLDDDRVATALRAAFTAEHGLQCGYCTPGMIVTARDIVIRRPDLDDDGVRLELAGNLCRCTGYLGIVRAIRRVLDLRLDIERPPRAAAPFVAFAPVIEAPAETGRAAAAARPAAGSASPGRLVQSLSLAVDAEAAWRAISDPALIVGCVPGVRLIAIDGEHIRGEMTAALGPIQASFLGQAHVSYDPETRSGRVSGSGRDPASGTQLNAAARFDVKPASPDASVVRIEINYDLQGPLAQFGRGPIVQAFATEMAEAVARNLAARLSGEDAPAAGRRLNLARLLWRTLLRWLGGSR